MRRSCPVTSLPQDSKVRGGCCVGAGLTLTSRDWMGDSGTGVFSVHVHLCL